jgi:hypothetical protein
MGEQLLGAQASAETTNTSSKISWRLMRTSPKMKTRARPWAAGLKSRKLGEEEIN